MLAAKRTFGDFAAVPFDLFASITRFARASAGPFVGVKRFALHVWAFVAISSQPSEIPIFAAAKDAPPFRQNVISADVAWSGWLWSLPSMLDHFVGVRKGAGAAADSLVLAAPFLLCIRCHVHGVAAIFDVAAAKTRLAFQLTVGADALVAPGSGSSPSVFDQFTVKVSFARQFARQAFEVWVFCAAKRVAFWKSGSNGNCKLHYWFADHVDGANPGTFFLELKNVKLLTFAGLDQVRVVRL